MAFIPATNVAHVQFVGETDGQETVNDLYFISTAPPITAVGLAALSVALDSWYGTQIRPLLSETWSYDFTRSRDLTSQNSFVDTNVNTRGAGGVTGEQAPNNVSANITLSTGLAGRNMHGSNRIPGIPNSVVTLNTLDETFLSDILTAYDLLLAPSTTLPGGWTWVWVSFFSGSFIDVDGKKKPSPRAAGVTHEIFDLYFTDAFVDSQKSRLPKHGK